MKTFEKPLKGRTSDLCVGGLMNNYGRTSNVGVAKHSLLVTNPAGGLCLPAFTFTSVCDTFFIFKFIAHFEIH